MAEVNPRETKVALTVTMTLTEAEARALENISGWSGRALTEALHKIGGDHKDRDAPHLVSFFDSCKGLTNILRRIDDARSVMDGRKVATRPEPQP